MAQKLQARKFLLVTPGNPPPLDLHRAVEHGVLWTLKRQEHGVLWLEKVKRHLGVQTEGGNYKQGGPRTSKSFFPPKESKSKILRGYCGFIEPVIYIRLLYWT